MSFFFEMLTGDEEDFTPFINIKTKKKSWSLLFLIKY
jgi:hypothetical protein